MDDAKRINVRSAAVYGCIFFVLRAMILAFAILYSEYLCVVTEDLEVWQKAQHNIF